MLAREEGVDERIGHELREACCTVGHQALVVLPKARCRAGQLEDSSRVNLYSQLAPQLDIVAGKFFYEIAARRRSF
jgi:hypothetical protein